MAAGVAKEAITVRLDQAKRAELDELARAMSPDRSFLVDEAIDTYLWYTAGRSPMSRKIFVKRKPASSPAMTRSPPPMPGGSDRPIQEAGVG